MSEDDCRDCGAYRFERKAGEGTMRTWTMCNKIGNLLGKNILPTLQQCFHPSGTILVIGEKDENKVL